MSPSLHERAGAAGRGRDVLVPALAVAAAFLARSVAGALVEGLRRELWLTDQALGTLVTAFAAAAAVAMPAFAVLAARVAPGRLLAAALVLCGTGTALSAAAVGFWSLVATRVAAGAGAGGAAVTAAALLAARRPGRTVPVILLAASLGLALGYLTGGAATGWHGWRAAFVAAGVGPAALALACRGLAAPGRKDDPWAALRAEGTFATLRRSLSTPGAAAALTAAVLGAASVSALVFWLPAFLERARGVPRSFAGGQLGAATLAGGLAGVMLGQALVAELGRRTRAPERWVAGGAAGAAALAVAAALGTLSPVVYLPAVMVALLASFTALRAAMSRSRLGGAGGPAGGALFALLLEAPGELGGAAALGAVADRASFGFALVLLPTALAAAGALWLVAAWRRERALQLTSRDARKRGAA